MSGIFNYFIEKWRLSFSFLMMILLLGLVSASGLQKEAFPNINIGAVIITTVYPGASTQETEENVTDIIERELRSVTGLKDVTSYSQAGLSRIVIRVDIDKEDANQVVDDIKDAVQRASPLPATLPVPPVVTELKSDEIAIMRVAVSSDEGFPVSERMRLAHELEERVELRKGVARADLEGYQNPEFQILLDQEKMKARNVGVTEVLNAVSGNVIDTPAGEIKWNGTKKLVRVTGKVAEAKQLENVVIRANFGAHSLKIRDVARVVDGNKEQVTSVRFNGRPAVTMNILKKASADILETERNVQEELEEFRKLLPPGITVDVYDSEGDRVKNKLSIVTGNAVAGVILVLVALLIFFPGSPGIMTAISMPISVLIVFGAMPVIGARINNITMTAIIISLGLLVDNSIVVGENYVALRHEGYKPLEAAKRAVSQFWVAIMATALTTIMSFMPMLVTTGVMGQFIAYIPLIVSIAIAASLLEAFILLPARLRFTMREKKGESGEIHEYKEKGWFAVILILFERTVLFALRHRYVTALLIPVVIALSLLLSVFGNYFELFPQTDVEIYMAKFEAKQGTSLEKTEKYASVLEQKMLDALDRSKVKYTITSIGTTQDAPFDTTAKFGENTGRIRLVFPLEVARQQNNKEILAKLREIQMPDEFESLWFESVAMGPPVGKALELTVSGLNETEILAAVKDLKDAVKTHPGTMDVNDDNTKGMPEIHFDVNRELLTSGGFSMQGLGRALRTAMQGEVASLVNARGEQIQVLVRYDDRFRTSERNIMDTTLTGMTGNQVPVGNLTRTREITGAAVRKHYQFQRAVTVSADVDNKAMTSVKLNGIVVNEILPELSRKYPKLQFSFLGEAESRKEAFQSLMKAMVFAIAFIAMILIFIFNSFLKPFIILGSIPLALIGVSVAFFVHQRPISFTAVIGIIGLMGVVINATIILISYIDILKQENKLKGHDLLAFAAKSRLKPILVTSLTTIGGFLPTAYGLGGYDPMLAPLTLAMAWGMITATFIGLIASPVFLAIIDDMNAFFSKRLGIHIPD